MEIEAFQLMARVGLFEHPVEPVRPVGEVVRAVITTQAQVDAANAHYDALARQDLHASRMRSGPPRFP